MSDKQVSFRTAWRTIMSSAGYLAIAAAVFLVLAAVLPVVTLSANIGGTDMAGLRGVAGGSVNPTGASLSGSLGWLAILAFAAAAAARFVRELAPFRRQIDITAFALLALAVIWSATEGPLATQIRTAGEVSKMFDGLGGATGGAGRAAMPTIAVTVLPSIGTLFILLAPIALVLARRREAVAAPRMV